MTGLLTYADAYMAYREGDLSRCHQITGQLLQAAPDGAAALLRAISTPATDVAKAEALYRASCRLAPYDADSWFNLGVWLEQQGRLPEATIVYRRALALDPQHMGALLNGTQMLRVNEYFEETLPHARRLQQLAPDSPAGFTHEAIALQHLGYLDEADPVFAQAVKRSADPALLHWEHHFSLLARSRFAEAWDNYEVRFACGEANGVDDMAFALPRWDGTPGQHVLVYGEQGIGDQLMFASALPQLAHVAERVSLAVAPALVAIFAASFPDIAVYSIEQKRDPAACAALAARAGAERPVDCVLPIGSLMTHFRRDRERFSGKPYLRASDDARAFWRARATAPRKGARRPFRVGLCWACNPSAERFFTARRAVHRTMPFDQIARLAAIEGVEASAITNVPLHMFGPDAAASTHIIDVSAALTNIDRTAALVEGLDLLVTVDTGVAHLAGALGVPVWVLLHKGGDARWGKWGTPDSYWYKSARLFWQQEAGNWPELIDRVAAMLKDRARAPRRRESA